MHSSQSALRDPIYAKAIGTRSYQNERISSDLAFHGRCCYFDDVNGAHCGNREMLCSRIMNTIDAQVAARSSPFFERAAWISIVTPLLAAISPLLFLNTFESNPPVLFAGISIVTALSLLCGIVSLFGYKRHRRKLTLWIAGVGVLMSGSLSVGGLFCFAMCFVPTNC